jgi:BirA family biotin operon repressor/biotin-[acetyl-CoA-carboxylase] ligase
MSKPLQQFEPLDANKIQHECSERLVSLEIFDVIDSTNSYLLQMKNASGRVCFAEQQMQGRGRRGRSWYSPAGANIYFSLAWDFSEKNISNLSLAVAVMVAAALKKYGILAGIQLKWPNDILFQGRKLAGILLERTGDTVVIGIGLNVFLSQEMKTEMHAIDLTEITGKLIERNRLAGLLVNELLLKLPVFSATGLQEFLQDWRERDALIHKQIVVHALEKISYGEMRGINDVGELLLLDEQNNLQQISHGEVTVRAFHPL